MKKYWKVVGTALLTCGLSWLGASNAHAGGLIIDASIIEAGARTDLKLQIDNHRSPLSSVYARVRDVQGVKPEVYKKQRNPIPNAGRELRALGKDALLPMLEVLAFDEAQKSLSATEKEALTVGLLEAVGEIKDARAVPVLTSIFLARSSSDNVAMAAASALGQMCRSSEVKLLTDHAAPGKARELAAIHGLGSCRSQASAEALVKLLSSAKGDTQNHIIRALGDVGSSWAWAASNDDGSTTRALISNALIDAYATNSAIRKEAARSILKASDSGALARVQGLKAKAERDGRTEDAKALGELEARIGKQVARSKR